MSVIQIGDVHFPEAKVNIIGDIKDRALSEPLRERIAVKKLRQVFLTLDQIRSKLGVCGLLICGDLTTNGNLDEYGKCIDYLKTNMHLDDQQSVPTDHWHVVPGNHDVARKTLQPNKSPFPELFRPLEAEWNKQFQQGALTVERLRASRMLHDNCAVDLFSLNSCIGCGEWRRIPAKILTSIADKIGELLLSEDTDTAKFQAIAEQLDAPVFDQEHVTALCEAIKVLDRKSVPIVLAHHNLLPQATPRVEIYTEMLNSGMLRSRLTNLDRPIVYCHGHIHDDPVEVVLNPQQASGRLVVVSAPEAVKGFNLLKIFFGKNHGPLGLEIVKYRLRNDGDVRPETPIRISFCQQAGMSPPLDDDVRSVVTASPREFEALTMVRERVAKGAEPKPQFPTLRDRLIEAEWHGLVELENRDDDDPKALRVRKVVP